MIEYKDQLKGIKYKTKWFTKKGIKVKRCLDIMTFDIETTSFFKDPDGNIIMYEPGRSAEFWNNCEKYALPYIWQFSFNDTVYYGREFSSFILLLGDLPTDCEFLIWVHNLSFEFVFLQNILHMTDVFARTPHKPMKSRSEEFPHIEFRCSYILTNLSLEKWGKQLDTKKLIGYLDYNVMRTPKTALSEDELKYCEYDCLVVYAGIKDHLKRYKHVWDIPLTSTGKVRRVVKKLVTNDREYMHDIKKCIPKSYEEYQLFQRVFSGGYTHANRKYVGKEVNNVHHCDIASSYPFSLCAFKYPYNKWSYYGARMPDMKTFEYRAYIMELHFKKINCLSWNSYIQASKCRGSSLYYDNGRILYADELYITVTEQDFLTIYMNYEWEEIEVVNCWVCQKRYLPKIFIEYILKLYGDKTSLKGVEGFEDQYAISKQYINSLFGMCVTALISGDVEFDQEDPEQWTVNTITRDKVEDYLEKRKRWYDKKYFLSYPVGCWCTAYSRRRLWEVFEYRSDSFIMDNNLIYADTDSCFYTGDMSFDWFNEKAEKQLKAMCEEREIDFELTRPKDPNGKPHPLGVMEFEPDSDVFKTLGAKKYLEQRDGKLYMTVAGVPKKAVGCLSSMQDFKEGFIFDKDNEYMHKLEHTYLTDMEPVIMPDGYKSFFRYGINLRPTSYELSVPDVYQDVQDLYNGVINISSDYDIKRRGFLL